MNSRHKKTLAAIIGNPIRRTLPFRDIESLLDSIGCTVKEQEGSRVVFVKDGVPWATHRPHPNKAAREYQIKQLRIFLKDIGVEA